MSLSKDTSTVIRVSLLILISLFLFCFRLSERDLWSSQEARAGLVAREMLESGDWIVPRVNGVIETQKPAAFYWLVGVVSLVTGVNEFSVRLPSALCALVSVLVTFFLGRRLFNERAGFLSALVLAASIKYLWLARTARIDMSLHCFMTLGMYCFYAWYSGDRKKSVYWLVPFYISLAVAVLLKGPIGLVVQGLCIGVFLFMDNKYSLRDTVAAVARMELLFGLILLCLLLLPWFIAIHVRTGGEFTSDFFFKQNIARFTGAGGIFGTAQPFWFYVPRLAADFLPWSLFLPFALVFILRDKTRRRATPFVFLLSWWFVMFLFFSCSSFKRADYILPLYPASALLVGNLWEQAYQGRHREGGVLNRYIAVPSLLLIGTVLVLAGLTLFVVPTGLLESVRQSELVHRYFNQKDIAQMEVVVAFLNKRLWLFIITALGIFGLSVFVFVSIARRRYSPAFQTIISAVLITNIMFVSLVLPQLDAFNSQRPFADKVRSFTSDTDRLLMYRSWDHGLAFYLERRIERVSDREALLEHLQEEGVSCIIRRKEYEQLKEDFGDKVRLLYQDDRARKKTYALIANLNR